MIANGQLKSSVKLHIDWREKTHICRNQFFFSWPEKYSSCCHKQSCETTAGSAHSTPLPPVSISIFRQSPFQVLDFEPLFPSFSFHTAIIPLIFLSDILTPTFLFHFERVWVTKCTQKSLSHSVRKDKKRANNNLQVSNFTTNFVSVSSNKHLKNETKKYTKEL